MKSIKPYLSRAIDGGADLDISRITPDSVPSSDGGKAILSPREHMEQVCQMRAGESAADRFTLGIQSVETDHQVRAEEMTLTRLKKAKAPEEIRTGRYYKGPQYSSGQKTLVEEEDARQSRRRGDTAEKAAPEVTEQPTNRPRASQRAKRHQGFPRLKKKYLRFKSK